MSSLILYTADDGQTRINLRVEGDSIWLSQLEIAELFQTTKQNVSLHAKNIFEEGELNQAATVKESLTVQTEGNRQVQRALTSYNLELILAIGYRIRTAQQRAFSQAWPGAEFVQQPAAQLPWLHLCTLLNKLKTNEERDWYLTKALQHNWSRNILVMDCPTGCWTIALGEN